MQKRIISKSFNKFGFTIIELLVVMVIVGILAVITYVVYTGIVTKVIDTSVNSDLQRMASIQLKYKADHGASGIAYYSGGTSNPSLGFTPSSGNVIDVVVNATDYCIRGYNPKGTKNTIDNSFTRESTTDTCYSLGASDQAVAASPGPSVWKQISVGRTHACAIASYNKAYCWGLNTSGQLGNNSIVDSYVPVAVDTSASSALNGKTIRSIAAGQFFTCAIASDNQAYCWGQNTYGQLGNGLTADSSLPVAVTPGILSGKTLVSITAGFGHTCVIASDNQAYCWGADYKGQLGNNSTSESHVPVAVVKSGVLNGLTLKSISAGDSHTCVIASNNQAYCWGRNLEGQLGNNLFTNSLVPVAVTNNLVLNGKSIKSIVAYFYHTCAIASDNLAYCWGNDSYGQLGDGDGSATNKALPTAVVTSGVLSGKTIVRITAGILHTCAIASDNQAYCWGAGSNGRLGYNSTNGSTVPVAVINNGALNGKTVKSISGGDCHTCTIASDNQIYCWGKNANGQLGNNSTTQSLVPVATLPPS